MKEMIIGILGGMGSYATLDFFNRYLNAFPAKKEWDRPRVLIDNNCVMPSRVKAILYNENVDKLIDSLSSSIRGLIEFGCTHIVLCCNTSHYFLPEIFKKNPHFKRYIIDIIDCCKKYMLSNNFLEAYLLATEGTIETKLYNNYFDKKILLFYPNKTEFSILREFIEAVKQNSIDKKICQKFVDYVNQLKNDNILLGCTELPVLYRKSLEFGFNFTKTIIDPLECSLLKLREIYYE